MARAAKRKIVPSPGERRGARLALGFVLLTLLLTIDDRHVGSVADERQMIWTAVAIAETGELGQARGRDFTLARDEVGDAVSRYGMGMSIAQLPAAIVAPVIEERRGAGSSQPLFLVAPLLFVIAGAALAGRLVRRLGGGPRAEIYAILLASIASPLGSYAAMGFTEPLQGALLAATLYFALGPSPAASGLAAGLAVLTKSANLAVAPFLLLPLLASPKSRTKNVIASAAAFFSVLMIWLGFEIVRFRVPLSSYPGEGFTHPLLDGLWRLLISPTEGLRSVSEREKFSWRRSPPRALGLLRWSRRRSEPDGGRLWLWSRRSRQRELLPRQPHRAKRETIGVDLGVERRYANNWRGSLQYSWKQGKGNTSSDANADLQGDLLEVDPRQPYMSGRLPGTIPHQFKLFGSYRTPLNIEIGALYYWSSGAYFTEGDRAYGIVIPHDLTPNDSRDFNFTEIGAEQHPSFSILDLKFAYEVGLVRGMGVDLFLDVYNVFDNQDALYQEIRWGRA